MAKALAPILKQTPSPHMSQPSAKPPCTLRRARAEDRPQIYRRMAQSDATREMLGPPTFPDCPVPSWEEFADDFSLEEFFQPGPPADSNQDWGECWIIEVEAPNHANGHPATLGVGQINFSDERDPADPRSDGLAELDIWIGDRQWWGQGIGRAAMEAMAGILRGYGFTTLLIRPSARNARAVAAYRRAGFIEQSNTSGPLPAWVYAPEGWDYRDSLVMVRQLTG